MTSTQQIINIGASPNDQQGDPLRVAFGKVNNNFSNLFATFVNTSNTTTTGNAAGQVIFQTPANTFTQGQFYVRSSNPSTIDSQNIQLSAQLSNDGTQVAFTGFGTTFFGNAVATYDMNISGGNVQILTTPLVNNSTILEHFISSQVIYSGTNPPGLDIGFDGYSNSVMETENGRNVTTTQTGI
jgi:hypothetical protein